MSQHQKQQVRKQHEWGYSQDSVGPNEWSQYYQTGSLQSPINILVNQCQSSSIHTTCCQGKVIEKQERRNFLAERLRAALNLRSSSGHLARAHQVHRRTHLNSVGEEKGEEHKRSPSSSSAGSKDNNSNKSGSSSPAQDDDDYDEEEDDEYDRQSYEDESGGSSPSYAAGDRARRLSNNNNEKASKATTKSASSTSSSSSSAVSVLCQTKNSNNNNNGSRRLTQQNTRFCVSHKKIFLGYPRYLNTMQLCNTGHSWQVNLPSELGTHTLLSGPPLGDREYRLAQFHCHWGEDCDHGSEHQINGKHFSAEIHFVHWNCTDFDSFEEASKHKHGLAVLGVLVQALEGEQNQNKHLEKIIAGLKRVHKPNSSVSIHAKLDLKKLFPTNRWNYASYEGSLTTPPLSEVVDWIVFLNPIQCSTSQIEQFRQIRCPSSVNNSGSHLLNNCRPIQPSLDRLVSIWSHH